MTTETVSLGPPSQPVLPKGAHRPAREEHTIQVWDARRERQRRQPSHPRPEARGVQSARGSPHACRRRP